MALLTPTRFALLAALATLAGCAQPFLYQPAEGNGPGYSEERIESDRWRVQLKGTRTANRADVERMLLLRAAELTLENNYGHFVVAEKDLEPRTQYAGFNDSPWLGYGFGFGRGYYGGYGSSFSQLNPETSYTGYLTIQMRPGPKPDGVLQAYDPRQILAQLSPRVPRATGTVPAPALAQPPAALPTVQR